MLLITKRSGDSSFCPQPVQFTTKGNEMINKNIQAWMIAAALLTGTASLPALAQSTDDHSKMSKSSGMKMSHDEMMAKMDKMSSDDKMMMIDKMSSKDRMAAMKMAGMDSSKMMSSDEKSAMWDKMTSEKKMKMMMAQDPTMHKSGKMDKMHDMDKMDKPSKP